MRECGCGKKVFTSAAQARRQHRHANFRIRVYPCPERHGIYHVTAQDKRDRLRDYYDDDERGQ